MDSYTTDLEMALNESASIFRQNKAGTRTAEVVWFEEGKFEVIIYVDGYRWKTTELTENQLDNQFKYFVK